MNPQIENQPNSPAFPPASPPVIQPPTAPPQRPPVLFIALSICLLIIVSVLIYFFVVANESNKNQNATKDSETTSETNTEDNLRHQRREAAAEILAAAESYASDHAGTYPTPLEVQTQLATYFSSQPIGPSSKKPYVIQPGPPTALNEVQYSTNATCNEAADEFLTASSSRMIAVIILTDDKTYYCASNS